MGSTGGSPATSRCSFLTTATVNPPPRPHRGGHLRGIRDRAKLVGSDDEFEGWRRRFRHGLSAGLSVGFTRDKRRDVLEAPRRRGGLPVMRPRGIEIAEVSLVQWPAYERAGVLSLSLRSAADQERHESSELLMAQMQELTWSIATRQARRREAADPK